MSDEPTEVEIATVKKWIEAFAETTGTIFPRMGVVQKAFSNGIEPKRTEAVFKHLLEREELIQDNSPSPFLKRNY